MFLRCPSVRPSVCLSVRPTVTFWGFLDILERQRWKFIIFCTSINIDKMYICNKNKGLAFSSFRVTALCNITYAKIVLA